MQSPRIRSLDMLRGLIMILMALDHFVYFINRFHPAEFWITAAPSFPTPAFEVFRWLSHLCAPGFVLLAGTSLVLFASRRSAESWSPARIRWTLILRGLVLLVVVQFGLEQLAWLLGDLGGRGIPLNPVSVPGAPAGVQLGYLGVIYVLAVSIMLGSLLYRLPGPVLAFLAAASILASPVALSFVKSAAAPINPVINALLVPGLSVFFTNYPLFPWFGVFLLGILLGRFILKRGREWAARIWLPALAAMLIGAAARMVQPWGESHRFDPSRTGTWFELSKYPPSIAYLGVTLGLLGMILWGASRLESARPDSRFSLGLEIFGREPLFFYVLHLLTYSVLCFVLAFPARPALTLAGWVISLSVFAPILYWYRRLKDSGKLPRVLGWL